MDCLMISISLLVLAVALYKLYHLFGSKNPFEYDCRRPFQPRELDQKKRNEILQNEFDEQKVPRDLDAVVIGSGMGGMSTAAILSKAGKKVLVLERHHILGGCCRTYPRDGYEFGIGCQYMGYCMEPKSPYQLLFDQISDGQIQFEPLDYNYDEIILNYKDQPMRREKVYASISHMKNIYQNRFPEEFKNLDKFFDVIEGFAVEFEKALIIKVLPHWLVLLLDRLGVIKYITKLFEYGDTSFTEFLNEINIRNPELRTLLCYFAGVAGHPPNGMPMIIYAFLYSYYLKGPIYPVGGPSEMIYQIVKVLRKNKGQAMTKARVQRILIENGKAVGVEVKHDKGVTELRAPHIISDAGFTYTFKELLPKEVALKSPIGKFIENIPLSWTYWGIYVGLNGSPEELEIPFKRNYVFLPHPDVDQAQKDFINSKTPDEGEYYALFFSFSSAKDPVFKDRYPNKTAGFFGVPANYNWFKDEKGRPLEGEGLESVKRKICDKAMKQLFEVYPKLKDYVEFVEVRPVLSNSYGEGTNRDGGYGLDFFKGRYTAKMFSLFRSTTNIKGLYLTGTDVSGPAVVVTLLSGVLCASSVLGRNLKADLETLQKSIDKQNRYK